jgi:lysyl-tRNA synthetase class 2
MLEEIMSERKKKLEYLKKNGIDPYPVRSKRTALIGEVLDKFAAYKKAGKKVYLTGRVRSLRDQGKIIFADLEDFSGKIQVILKKDTLKNFETLKKALDIGDFLEIGGKAILTKSGQKSVDALEARIIVKSLRPLPKDFYGIEDVELRLRKRYLDSIIDGKVRELFAKKSVFWSAAREFLAKAGFLEVDTPVLEETPGGAEAEPFKTHYNALNEDFYLRISLEIALKKMLVGGFEKIFEIGRIFRNEGIDAQHLQDYTQCEFYWAYSDYRELMKFVEKLYKFIIKKAVGSLTTVYQGTKINWGGKWKTADYCQAFKKATGLDPNVATRDALLKKAHELKIFIEAGAGKGRVIDLIFKKTVRLTLVQPTFLVNPPAFVEPLAKRSSQNPLVVERFQIMVAGTELGKGFSENNNPLDQRERFEEQMKLRVQGDKEAQQLDENFLEALEYGMPPAAGFGFSERLFAVLMDKPIREIVFFPAMKRKND